MAIFQRGGVWYVDYYDGTKRVKKAIGKKKTDAIAYLGKIQGMKRENRLFDMKKDYSFTFDELLEKYKEAFSGQKYYPTKTYYFPIYARYFSGVRLGDVTPYQLEMYRNERKAIPVKNGIEKLREGYKQRIKETRPVKDRSGAAVNRELSTLRHLFSKAEEWGMMEVSPFKKVRNLFYKEKEKMLRFLSEEEEITLLNVLSGQVRNVVLVATHTGMRLGEILNLRWDDIRNGFIYLTETKTYMPRQIPLNETLGKVLDSIPRHISSEYVFWGKDGKPLKSVSRGFEGALKKAGIKNFRFHDLRHTFASRLVMRGASLKAVQELLGHRNIKMTMRYSHLSEDYKRQTVRLLDTQKTDEYQEKTHSPKTVPKELEGESNIV